MSPENLAEIEQYVLKKSPVWGEALVIWLHASTATGLRPNEWTTAEIKEVEGRLLLKVENFKHNEIRSYDTHRTIDLTRLPDEFKVKVKQQVSVVKGMLNEGMYQSYYKGCSDLLLLINKRLWPHRKANIQLYTGRHQFSANAKASDTTEVERAAMMGHKTTKTSRERYGRRRNGGGGRTPEIANKAVLSKIANPEAKVAPQSSPKTKHQSPPKRG